MKKFSHVPPFPQNFPLLHYSLGDPTPPPPPVTNQKVHFWSFHMQVSPISPQRTKNFAHLPQFSPTFPILPIFLDSAPVMHRKRVILALAGHKRCGAGVPPCQATEGPRTSCPGAARTLGGGAGPFSVARLRTPVIGVPPPPSQVINAAAHLGARGAGEVAPGGARAQRPSAPTASARKSERRVLTARLACAGRGGGGEPTPGPIGPPPQSPPHLQLCMLCCVVLLRCCVVLCCGVLYCVVLCCDVM